MRLEPGVLVLALVSACAAEAKPDPAAGASSRAFGSRVAPQAREPSLLVPAATEPAASAASGIPSGWTIVGEGKLHGIGGCAFERRDGARQDFLVVHDNKIPDQPRIGRVSLVACKASYTTLAWPAGAEWPIDLESISAVPDHAGRFAALASSGRLFVIDVAGEAVSLVGAPIDLPKTADPKAPNYEAFDLWKHNTGLFAVWADRGDKQAPAKLFWGPFDPIHGPTIAGEADVRVSWPETDRTRDISDLRVDPVGVVWCTAAWDDDNDDSTYRSAAYVVGVLRDPMASSGFQPAALPQRVRSFSDRKAEALELVPGADGGIVFGSDDENHGGWLLADCGPCHVPQ